MLYGKYIYVATAVIVLAEIVLGRHKGIYTRSSWFVLVGCVTGNQLLRPISALLIATAAALLLPRWKGALSGMNPWLAFLAVLTVAEFCFYWVHRWAHETRRNKIDWLWKLHRTHHAGKFMNVFVTLRINWFWQFVVPTTWVLGFATYLGLELAAAQTILAIYGWNLITHANFRWDDPIRRMPKIGRIFRALEHILVSPGIHHSHHGYGKDGWTHGNYAVTFSWLDWMFGTLHIPEGRPWRYGLPGPNPHWAEEVAWPLWRAREKTRDGHDTESEQSTALPA
ncbi:MAG: sterol desaturase family protein [Novosphingobium sp.]|nr:sterol desaturase family protein [Novosphingobium sp.]